MATLAALRRSPRVVVRARRAELSSERASSIPRFTTNNALVDQQQPRCRSLEFVLSPSAPRVYVGRIFPFPLAPAPTTTTTTTTTATATTQR
uniref:Uncharacterized protein n=1 Tax=Anopheles albimanus TaxID=7167 RepID=A0A182FWI4_ANOAL